MCCCASSAFVPTFGVASVKASAMEQPLEKRTAVAAAGTSSTDLLRLWQGDLVEPLLAFLPLKAIATVPMVSRRLRDQQWRTYSLIARQTGTICTSTSSFLDAVRWTGRDERWSRFDGSNFEAWETLARNEDAGFNCSRDGNGRLRIETYRSDSGDHGGGLVKRFDGENLCVRRVTYTSAFTIRIRIPTLSRKWRASQPSVLAEASLMVTVLDLQMHSLACLLSRATVTDTWMTLHGSSSSGSPWAFRYSVDQRI